MLATILQRRPPGVRASRPPRSGVPRPIAVRSKESSRSRDDRLLGVWQLRGARVCHPEPAERRRRAARRRIPRIVSPARVVATMDKLRAARPPDPLLTLRDDTSP
jgi:hypothetical protein